MDSYLLGMVFPLLIVTVFPWNHVSARQEPNIQYLIFLSVVDSRQGNDGSLHSDNLLWLARHQFWVENRSLPESEIQRLWTRRVVPPTSLELGPSSGQVHGIVHTTPSHTMAAPALTSIPMEFRSHTVC